MHAGKLMTEETGMKRCIILRASVLGSAASLPHTHLQAVSFERCEHARQSLYASCCVILLHSSRYFSVRVKLLYSLCLFVFYVRYLCEKYLNLFQYSTL